VDPKPKDEESPYATFSNNPILFTDVQGDSAVSDGKGGTAWEGNVTDQCGETFSGKYSVEDIRDFNYKPELKEVEIKGEKPLTKFINSGQGASASQKQGDIIQDKENIFEKMNNGNFASKFAYDYANGLFTGAQTFDVANIFRDASGDFRNLDGSYTNKIEDKVSGFVSVASFGLGEIGPTIKLTNTNTLNMGQFNSMTKGTIIQKLSSRGKGYALKSYNLFLKSYNNLFNSAFDFGANGTDITKKIIKDD
jgi:hypothetical protein